MGVFGLLIGLVLQLPWLALCLVSAVAGLLCLRTHRRAGVLVLLASAALTLASVLDSVVGVAGSLMFIGVGPDASSLFQLLSAAPAASRAVAVGLYVWAALHDADPVEPSRASPAARD